MTQQVIVTGRRSDFKVRLTGPGGEVVFEHSVPMSESRQSSYGGYDIVHLPTALQSYKNTTARTFEFTAKLVSRTADEAEANANSLDRIRSWILPDFGGTGATPPILKIYGYRNKNIDGRRVVLKSYGWSFPDDVDYIFTSTQAMPVIGSLQIGLEEIYSAEEVTAGAWKISTANGGFFEKGFKEGSSSFLLTGIGWGRDDPLSTTIPATRKAGSIMSQLASGKVTIPGVIAGTIARTLGEKVLNSPAIREVTGALPPVLSNIFVGGANVAIGEAGKAVTTVVSQATQPTQPNGSFNRTADLPVKGPIG